MYGLEDLFDKRSVVGTRLERILEERNYTKAELCKKSGVSRPTIDKLLSATLTSKTNYEKHVSKILNCLEMTPDMLLGNVANSYSRARSLRSLMELTTEQISEVCGISLNRLKQIESGENATVAELRDIAICLSASVKDLLGENFFEPQISAWDDLIRFNQDPEDISGFWGHIGISLDNRDEYLWYPITSNTRAFVYNMISNERVVVPCMNNKVLLLYMPNVKEIILLDDACDQPQHVNWDPKVSCGEIPLVVFESLEDYIYRYEEDEDKLSEKFIEYLDKLVEHKGWSENDMRKMFNGTTIYYQDGKTRPASIDFESSESIIAEIINGFEFGDFEFSADILFFEDMDGSENFINLQNISMVEMPLLQVESAIVKSSV